MMNNLKGKKLMLRKMMLLAGCALMLSISALAGDDVYD